MRGSCPIFHDGVRATQRFPQPAVSLQISGDRDRRDHGRDSGSPCRGRGPIGGHVRTARDHLPNSPRRNARHRGAAPPTELPHRVAESNNHRATCSAAQLGTNSRQPKHTRGPVLTGERAPRVVAGARRS